MSSSIDAFVEEIRHHLRTETIGRVAVAFDQTESTNEEARAGILQGAATGTLYVADHQTKGRGRLGRRWKAEPGSNLTFSVILRPPERQVQRTAVAAAVGLQRALRDFVAPLSPAVKWPNDLIIEGRKCAGMLLEHVSQSASYGVVLGMGVNVNQSHFSPDDAPNATSLLLSTGRFIPRAPLLCRILEELERALDQLTNEDAPSLLTEYERLMYHLGERVILYQPNQERSVEGIVRGVAPDGALRLETDDGIRRFYAGDVTSHLPSEAR